jgi:hypothetical protein
LPQLINRLKSSSKSIKTDQISQKIHQKSSKNLSKSINISPKIHQTHQKPQNPIKIELKIPETTPVLITSPHPAHCLRLGSRGGAPFPQSQAPAWQKLSPGPAIAIVVIKFFSITLWSINSSTLKITNF